MLQIMIMMLAKVASSKVLVELLYKSSQTLMNVESTLEEIAKAKAMIMAICLLLPDKYQESVEPDDIMKSLSEISNTCRVFYKEHPEEIKNQVKEDFNLEESKMPEHDHDCETCNMSGRCPLESIMREKKEKELVEQP